MLCWYIRDRTNFIMWKSEFPDKCQENELVQNGGN